MLLWLFFQSQAIASPQNIAVLDLLMTPEDSTQRQLIEDEVRAILFQSTQPDEINVLTRDKTKDLLEKNEKPFRCLNLSCMNDLARSINTDFVIFGAVEQQGNQWNIDIRLFDKEKNIVVATVESTEPDMMTLIQNLDERLVVLKQSLPITPTPQKEQKVKTKEPPVPPPPIKKEPQKLRFHFLSFQCTKNKYGFNIVGYCHSGTFIGPVHLGGIVYSQIDDVFLGIIQTSIYNQPQNFFGALQVGVVNNTKNKHFGMQLAVVNTAKELSGWQVGTTNLTNDMAGLQLGVVNTATNVHGFQGGLINTATRVHGIQAGLINTTQYLYGVQVGFLNFSKHNAAPMTVGLNIGW